MFDTREVMHGWDGRYHGRPQPGDVYVWQCTYEIGGKPEMQKGTVVLVR